jgi:Lsr2
MTPRPPDQHYHPIMAKSVSVVTTDDLDGSENAETVTFSLNGVTYEIDLSEQNRARLVEALVPYIEHGRRAAQRRRRVPGAPAGARVDRAAVRAWAKERGLKVSERGRISSDVMEQYEAAH